MKWPNKYCDVRKEKKKKKSIKGNAAGNETVLLLCLIISSEKHARNFQSLCCILLHINLKMPFHKVVYFIVHTHRKCLCTKILRQRNFSNE